MHRSLAKKLTHAVLAVACARTMLLLAACKPDPCEDITCVHGQCVEGQCICDPYYEGQDCSTESREKWLGSNWYNSRICPSGGMYWVSKVEAAGSHAGAVLMTNVHQAPDTVQAQVKGDTLTVPIQVYGVEYIEGEGFYTQGTITLEYRIIQTGGGETACTALLTR